MKFEGILYRCVDYLRSVLGRNRSKKTILIGIKMNELNSFKSGDLVKIQYPDAWEGHSAIVVKRGRGDLHNACKVWTIFGFGWINNRDMKPVEAM
jgi:hypothetical protein